MDFLTYWKETWRGKDTYRILMNECCGQFELRGQVADLGSGESLASYHRFFKKTPLTNIAAIDLKTGEGGAIDLEKDRLPFSDFSVDQILMFNLLEHVYNYTHLLGEARRILKNGGQIFGAVPFLIGYHPDPRDFFRYTSEALEKIFGENSLKVRLKILGYGPLTAAFSQCEFICFRILKFFVYPLVYALDWLIFKIKPSLSKEKFALGLFFVANK